MPILPACCCFKDLKTGARASAIFTMVTSIVNFVIDVAALVNLTYLRTILEPQTQWLLLPPGIVAFISIELVFTIALFVLGVVLHIGINFGYDGKNMVFSWIIGMVADRVYDCFLGIYILAWIGGHRLTEVIYVMPECIVVAVYWILNSFLLIAAILCVVSYWQELKDELFGKERRLKYFSKLANLRQAALSGHATPYKSYYSSRSVLGLSENQSLLSLDHSFQPSM